jgi:hypothetical protein
MVIVARVVASPAVDSRYLLGGCTPPSPWRITCASVRLRLESVLAGVAPDTEFTLHVRRDQISATMVDSGARILAWANRNCHDNWEPWGDFVRVDAMDRLVYRNVEARSNRIAERPRTLRALRKAVTSTAFQNASALFDSAVGVLLVRVNEVEHNRVQLRYEFACDSLNWLIGGAPRAPRILAMPIIAECWDVASRGDFLAIPVAPTRIRGDTLFVRCCVSGLMVEAGVVRAFGVGAKHLTQALTHRPDGTFETYRIVQTRR